jgi:predicted DsbA family dithiol-disulfide isomerase
LTTLPSRIDFYFDPSCPYAYATAVWMRDVKAQLGDQSPAIIWKPFSLRQQNFPNQTGQRVWERDADDKPGRGQRGFRLCALAEQKFGNDGVERMYAALGAARFDRQQDVEDEEVLLACAAEVGLRKDEARAAMADRSLDAWLAAGHDQARKEHGVFGVPTLTFDGQHPLFVAMRPPAPSGEAVDVLRQIVHFASGQSYLRELKRAPGPAKSEVPGTPAPGTL